MHHIPGLRDKVVDSRTPRAAPLRAGASVAQRTAADGHAVPEPGARRRTTAGREPRHRLRSHLDACPSVPSNERASSSAAPPSISPGPAPISPSWLRRGHATAAVVRPDRTVMRAGRHVDELCDCDTAVSRRPEGKVDAHQAYPAMSPTTRRTSTAGDAIIDPYPHYARLREQGPVVWLSRHRVYALPRYAECKAVLRDDKTFVSGKGVALNRLTNRLSRGTTLTSDGAEHDQRRKLVAHRMLPRALRAISDNVDQLAADVVDAALERGEIDGVADLASALPHGGGARPRRLAARRARQPAGLGRSDLRRPRPAEQAGRQGDSRHRCRC